MIRHSQTQPQPQSSLKKIKFNTCNVAKLKQDYRVAKGGKSFPGNYKSTKRLETANPDKTKLVKYIYSPAASMASSLKLTCKRCNEK
jgi:hypothetical protein